MKKAKILMLIVATAVLNPVTCCAADVSLKISKRYINFPISHAVDRHAMVITGEGIDTCRLSVRLAEGEPDYWVFRDVSALAGTTITISYDGSDEALAKVCQADSIVGGGDMYDEAGRPQYHFTTRRGWINDPNGLVYYKGVYHLYYQHNPMERDWGNMHWGHATSTDLVHWTEQPLALHPDTIGTVFSGSAVIDYGNTAGFNAADDSPALVAVYTADCAEKERQCVAYSLDGGMTFTKYDGNPVIDSYEKWQSRDTRDPRVFWYGKGKHWVMVLNERDGHTIYTSLDLKNWTYRSHVTGFWECPELVELAVDGDAGNKKWVMWGASGTYMTGDFDGERFTPDGPKKINLGGSAYAGQTYNNIPPSDGRTIKIAWGRVTFDDMPFKGFMLLPQEQLLQTSNSGLRLISRPVKEVEELCTKVYSGGDMTATDANEALRQFADNDVLRIHATLRLTCATSAGLSYRGQALVDYDMNGNRLNGDFYVPDEPGSMMLDVDVYIDRSVVEVFVDGGTFSYSMKRDMATTRDAGYVFWGDRLMIDKIDVFSVESIWNK